jgi:AGCS family alanine or glycine:cation symporter
VDAVANFLSVAVGYAWGLPLIILSVGGGLYLTFLTRGIQFRGFRHAVHVLRGKYDKPEDEGDITHFQALSAALSATIGLGNIAGVAVAMSAGGPGALVWMWIVALVGMATKFTTCSLAVMYREIHEDGSASGGPMYYIEMGLGKKWKPLAVLFAMCAFIATFGGGNMFQSNQVASALHEHFAIPKYVTGILLAVGVGVVIIGGIRRIGQVAARIVPFMCVIYMVGGIIVILMNIEIMPEIIRQIFKGAWTGTAAFGGFAGAGVRQVLMQGVRRATFSNEAGLGSAPIAHAAAKTKEPIREGLVGMLGPFVDTILICSTTALVILATGAWSNTQDLSGVNMTILAFDTGLPGFGRFVVSAGVTLFAYSTMISWSYYGEKSIEYLAGSWAITPYRWLYVIVMFLGCIWTLQPVLDFSDIMYAAMVVPNLIGTIFLSFRVRSAMDDYMSRFRGE